MRRAPFTVGLGRLVLAAGLLGPVGIFALGAAPAGATPSGCSVVSVTLLDAKLGIQAAHVNASHPASPVGALICSYFGNSGRSANQATINFLPTTPKLFAAVEKSLSTSHKIRTISGIWSGAYSYDVGKQRFLYVRDGSSQVQLYATVALAKLEALARSLPSLT